MAAILEGRVALVTGAASGIGRAIAERLRRERAQVVATDLAESADVSRLDVTRVDDWNRVVGDAVSRYGHVDYLFNNAGIGVAGEVTDLSLDHWRLAIDVNLLGVVNGIRAVYPGMVARRAGCVVNVASLAGLVPSPGMAPYAAAKHAVVGLSLSMRTEAESHGVSVSCFCPGFLETAIYENAVSVNVDSRRAVRKMGLRIAPLEPAIDALFRGIERNRALIVHPTSAKVLWRLQRLAPGLGDALAHRTLSGVRASTSSPPSATAARRARPDRDRT
jgi:NAD(P)-dependent dehydrogenase (short-subunit alcohol dehydrogenase family)